MPFHSGRRRSRHSNAPRSQWRQVSTSEEGSDDSDDQPTTSNRSQNRRQTQNQSQSQTQKKKFSDDEMNTAVGAAVAYILRANEGKSHILKQNIQKVALQQTKFYAEVMKEVEKRMAHVFGYRLHTFETGKYILSNLIPNTIPHITIKPEAKKKLTLLFLILSHIFMSEDICVEDTLWNFLHQLGIVTHEIETDPHFGNVRALVNDEFVKQKYVEKIKKGDREHEYFEYRWGVRAEQELQPRTVLKFVEEVYNTRMENFKNQFAAMQLRERTENRNQADAAPQSSQG